MKRTFLAAICFVTLVAGMSCRIHGVSIIGMGNRISMSPVVPAFSSVEISVPVNAVINVQEGATPSVKVSGYENLLKYIQVTVENGRLTVSSDKHWNLSFSDDDSMGVVITMPAINGLTMVGSPDAFIHGAVNSDLFRLVITGSSDVTIDSLNVKDFSSSISGSGDLRIRGGSVQHADYHISGSGDIAAFALQTQETVASISGSGSGEFTALQRLTASISGSGDISYKGHPAVNQDISGSGSIEDANR